MKTIEQGRGYLGPNAEVRHVVIVTNCGRGHRVFWDSISSRDPDYFGSKFSHMKNRPHGLMAMRDFQKLAVSLLT